MNLCAETLFSGPPEKLSDHQILWAGGPVDHCSKKFVSNPAYSTSKKKAKKKIVCFR